MTIRVVDILEKNVANETPWKQQQFSGCRPRLCPCSRVCFVATSDGLAFDVAHYAPACDALKIAKSRAEFDALCADPLTGKVG